MVTGLESVWSLDLDLLPQKLRRVSSHRSLRTHIRVSSVSVRNQLFFGILAGDF